MILLRRLLFHFFFFLVTGLLSTASVALMGWLGAFISMSLLWLPLLGILPWAWKKLFRRKAGIHWLAIPMYFMTVYGVCHFFPNLPALYAAPVLPVLPVSEIPAHPGQVAFRFSDARIQERYGYYRLVHQPGHQHSRTSTNTYCVAPITAAAWTADQPITAWSVCSDNDIRGESCAHWSEANCSAVEAYAEDRSVLLETIAEACKKYGLKNAGGFRLLVWTPSLEGEKQYRLYACLASVFLVYAVWALVYCLRYAFSSQCRQEAEKAETDAP